VLPLSLRVKATLLLALFLLFFARSCFQSFAL
jgi:hypothetical protein